MRSHFFTRAAKTLRYVLRTGIFGSTGPPQMRQPLAAPVCARMDSKFKFQIAGSHHLRRAIPEASSAFSLLVYLAGIDGDFQRP